MSNQRHAPETSDVVRNGLVHDTFRQDHRLRVPELVGVRSHPRYRLAGLDENISTVVTEPFICSIDQLPATQTRHHSQYCCLLYAILVQTVLLFLHKTVLVTSNFLFSFLMQFLDTGSSASVPVQSWWNHRVCSWYYDATKFPLRDYLLPVDDYGDFLDRHGFVTEYWTECTLTEREITRPAYQAYHEGHVLHLCMKSMPCLMFDRFIIWSALCERREFDL